MKIKIRSHDARMVHDSEWRQTGDWLTTLRDDDRATRRATAMPSRGATTMRRKKFLSKSTGLRLPRLRLPPGLRLPTGLRLFTGLRLPRGLKLPREPRLPTGLRPPPGLRPQPGLRLPPELRLPRGLRPLPAPQVPSGR